MKKLMQLFFLILISLSVYAQNELKHGNYFLLLNNNKSISLNTFDNNSLNVIRTFEITDKSIYTTDQNKRVAILDTSNNNILLYDFQSSKELKLSVPFKIDTKAILLNENNLFIGGEMGEEMLVQYHIEKNKWFSLKIPEEVKSYKKAIDDLVINNDFLIAIDNVVTPKYILFYNLNSNTELSLSHFERLKSNGPYETIFKGKISSDYLVLISQTNSSYTGLLDHITVYEGLNLRKSFAIALYVGKFDFHVVNDFVIIDNKIFFADNDVGLGVFDIKESYFTVSDDKYGGDNYHVDERIIKYKKYEDVEILHLTIVPNNSKIILTIKNALGEIVYEIIDI